MKHRTHTEPEPIRKRRRGRIVTTVLTLSLAGGGTAVYYEYFGGSARTPGINDVSASDAQQESTLAAQEDLRIMQTRAVLTSALSHGGARAAQVRDPHIASSANGRTLVLTARRVPYYVSDLERLAQNDFQQQNDGSYLLGINVFVASGAKLVLQSATGPLTIKMRSVPGTFTSIVGYGASIRINGSTQNPVSITSWNDQAQQPDTRVADGRSYIRAIGGELRMNRVNVSDLGFWSGRTGGIALTGTDRPSQAAVLLQPQARQGAVLMPDGTAEATSGGHGRIEVTSAVKGGGNAVVLIPTANLVTGSIQNSHITGNAFGIFISASDGTQIINDTVRDSLVHGVMMHRFARNAGIENTVVTGSRGDGFVLSRATQNVKISSSTAEDNGGNGFTLDGLPLASGPSASGEGTSAFGNNAVTGCTARGNGHYGVEVRGGIDLAVQTSRVEGGDMGIVVDRNASRVQISGNRLVGQNRQGITVRDGVIGTDVSGNIVSGTDTGIYLRGSRASVTGNTVESVSSHAVALVGAVDGTHLADNTLSGAGPSAIDTRRVTGKVAIDGNNTTAWKHTAGPWTLLGRIFTPLNVIWATVFLLVFTSAIRSAGGIRRLGHRLVHPYEHQQLLEERPARLLGRDTATAMGAPPDRLLIGADGGHGAKTREQ